jgi:hypothetical protein
MPRTKKQAHEGPHKYKRIEEKTRAIYKCVLPGCTHYLPESHIEGAISICWRQKTGCEKIVVMDKLTIGLVKPHCEPCTRGYVKKGQGANPKTSDVMSKLDALIGGLSD